MQKVRTSQILDASGQQIKITEALGEEQTSRLGYIAKEYANHPSGGLTPGKLAAILRAAEQGDLVEQMDLFEDMEEKDGHVFADMSKRKRAIMGVEWDIKPPRNASAQEKKMAEQLKEWVEDLKSFKSNLFDMADAIGKGFSMMEITWQQNGKVLLPELEYQLPRYFTIDEDNRNKLLLRNSTGKGDELWPFKWVQHVHKAKSGSIARGGLHRILAWPYLFKNYSVRDLAEFLEIYGIPMRIGTYPSGASDAEKTTLLRAVVGIGHNSAGIMPEGMKIEFENAASGQSDPFQFMVNWCESVQSKVILGGTLTSTAANTGLGSNLGDIHNEVRHDLLESDCEQIAETINRDLIWPIIALNFSGIDPKRAPTFTFITDEGEELNARVERDKTLHEIGFKLTPEKVLEVYGDGYIPVQNQIITPTDTLGTNDAATAAAKAGDNTTQLDGVIQRLGSETQPSINQLFDKVKALLDEVDSLEEFQDRLVEAFSYLDPEALADIIQMGLSTAELAGRYEVDNGN